MEIINQNPYRVLGLLANSTERELQNQISRMNRYAEVNKTGTSDFDFVFLGTVSRTSEAIRQAASQIKQSHKKIPYALSWFVSLTDFDEIALSNLTQDNVEKAIETWDKTLRDAVTSRNYSSYNNLSTLYFALAFRDKRLDMSKLEQSLALMGDLFGSSAFQEFCEVIGGRDVIIDRGAVTRQFIDDVILAIEPFMGSNKRVKSNNIISLFKHYPEHIKNHLIERYTSSEFAHVESRIEETEERRKADRGTANDAGEILYQTTLNEIETLKSILSQDDMKLQLLIDNLAEELMQCSIDYFNSWHDDDHKDPGNDALKIANYAVHLKPNGRVKNWVDENTQNIKDWINNEPQRKQQAKTIVDVEYVLTKLAAFIESSPSSASISNFLSACQPRLNNIKRIAGSNDDNYLLVCGAVISSIMGACVQLFNRSQEELSQQRVSPNAMLTTIDSIVDSLTRAQQIDMADDIRSKLNSNKRQIQGLRSTFVNYARHASKSGCYIATMAYGDYNHPQVVILREFRDNVLSNHLLGRLFIKVYYTVSPKCVVILKNQKSINSLIKRILDKCINVIKA